jgi:hypothetical protein
MSQTCHCACHVEETFVGFMGASVEDPIHAASACDSCLGSHTPALLSVKLANAPEYDPVSHAANFCAWVDGCSDATGEVGG